MNIKRMKKNGKYVRDVFGRYRYEFRINRNKKEMRRRIWAEDDADAARQAALLSKQTDLIRLRWSEGLHLWEEGHKKNCSMGYVEDICLHVMRFIDEFGDVVIETTSHQTMLAYINRRANGNLATANRVRRILWVARWLRKNGFIHEIPFEYIPQFKCKPVHRKPILPEELPRYLSALNDFSRPIVKMLAFTGLRSGALCSLKESDIQNNSFTVREKWGKTRTILIDGVLSAVLEEARVTKARKGSLSKFVFIHIRGGKWDPRSLCRHCTRKWKEAGLEHRQIHSLRHGFATIAALSGFSPRQLQAALDHEKFSTTERYLHDLQKTLIADQVGQAVRAHLMESMGSELPPFPLQLNEKTLGTERAPNEDDDEPP